MSAHITHENLERYFAGELSEDACELIEQHLGVCFRCAESLYLTVESSAALDEITPERHGEVYFRAVSGRAVASAALQAQQGNLNAEWQDRLTQWRDQWNGLSAGAARVLRDTKERTQILVGGLQSLVLPPQESIWRLQFGEGLRQAVLTRGEPSIGSKAGVLQASLEVNEQADEVTAFIYGWPEEEKPPLIMLTPMHVLGAPRVVEAEPAVIAGRPCLRARFNGLEIGEYLIECEPKERAAT